MSVLLAVIISVPTALTAITVASLRHVRKMREFDVAEQRRIDDLLREEEERPIREARLVKEKAEADARRNVIAKALYELATKEKLGETACCHKCNVQSQSKTYSEMNKLWLSPNYKEAMRGLLFYKDYFDFRVSGETHHDAILKIRSKMCLEHKAYDGPTGRFEINHDDREQLSCQMCCSCGAIWSILPRAKKEKK